MYALVDCNNFFASCEQVFNPRLRNRPLVILSNNDGCVIARSKEAKALSIPMGAPAFKYRELFLKHSVVCLSSNFSLYGDMSKRAVHVLEEMGLPLEIYSIDESFLDLSAYKDSLYSLGTEIIFKLWNYLSLPVSVGIAPSKTLAKMANKIVKNDPLLKGLLILNDASESIEHLKKFPVEDLWGIGRASAADLHKEGIYTAFALMNKSDAWIKSRLKTPGLRLVWELRGISCYDLEDLPSPKKGIISSRSFAHDVYSLEELKEAIAYFASKASYKLRKQKSVAHHLSVFIAPSRFSSHYQYAESAQMTLPIPTNYTPQIIEYAQRLLNSIYRENVPYKRAGVGLLHLTSQENAQPDFFHIQNIEKQSKLMHMMDLINEKSGKKAVFLGSEGLEKRWLASPQQVTPRYTTCWEDIPIIDSH